MGEYVLGTNEREIARLELQHTVWSPVTERFFERMQVGAGARVVDLGCGPGFVTRDLARRVGASGRVLAVDESALFLAHVDAWREREDVRHVATRRARLEELELEPGSCDAIFARWVFSFVPDPDATIARLALFLAPGGVLMLEDYEHDGIAVFPRSRGFEAAIRATRALYASRGGDAWIAARIPRAFRLAGLAACDWTPNVMSGGPESPAFRWADAFFPPHSQALVDGGFLQREERERFLVEWDERRRDPDARFFSPFVVDMAARKPRA